jgi:hypothetical protein
MKFKPFTKKYDFSEKAPTSDFPAYFAQPLFNWFLERRIYIYAQESTSQQTVRALPSKQQDCRQGY